MRITTPRLFFASIFLISLQSNSMADAKLVYSDTMEGNPTPKITTIFIKGSKVSSSNDQSPVYTIFDAEEEALYTVNKQEKKYIKATFDSFKAMSQQAAKMKDEMKSKLKAEMEKMPAEQRKIMEQKMAQLEEMEKAAAPKVESQKTGKTEMINGLDCELYTVSINETASRESCISEKAIDKDDLKTLQAMFGFMNKMAQQNARLQGQHTPDFSNLPSYSTGLALRIQSLPAGIKSELTTLNTDDIDNKNVSVPSDFELIDPTKANTKAPQ
jgi:hypothetical protein